MILPTPRFPDTQVNESCAEWRPTSFENFLGELQNLVAQSSAERSLLIFRGQRDRNWLLDSKFVRSCKAHLFGMEAGRRFSKALQQSNHLNDAFAALFFLKFDLLIVPSQELANAERNDQVDAYFELHRRLQQYPDIDQGPLLGSNFVDWSRSSDVALYFANEQRVGDGALFVCDASATGKTQQTASVSNVVDVIWQRWQKSEAFGGPLLFSPAAQIADARVANQQAIYFAQMDMRYDLEEIWSMREMEQPDQKILVKLVLPDGTQGEVTQYLESKGIKESFIYPPE